MLQVTGLQVLRPQGVALHGVRHQPDAGLVAGDQPLGFDVACEVRGLHLGQPQQLEKLFKVPLSFLGIPLNPLQDGLKEDFFGVHRDLRVGQPVPDEVEGQRVELLVLDDPVEVPADHVLRPQRQLAQRVHVGQAMHRHAVGEVQLLLEELSAELLQPGQQEPAEQTAPTAVRRCPPGPARAAPPRSPVGHLQHLVHVAGADADGAGVHEADDGLHRVGVGAALRAPLLQLHAARTRLGEAAREQRREVLRGGRQHGAVRAVLAGRPGPPPAERQSDVAVEAVAALLVLPPGQVGAVRRAPKFLRFRLPVRPAAPRAAALLLRRRRAGPGLRLRRSRGRRHLVRHGGLPLRACAAPCGAELPPGGRWWRPGALGLCRRAWGARNAADVTPTALTERPSGPGPGPGLCPRLATVGSAPLRPSRPRAALRGALRA